MPDTGFPTPRFSSATVDNPPVSPTDAANKAYVDTHGGGGGGGIPEAPVDANTYGRNNAVWNPVVPLSQRATVNGVATLDNTGKVPIVQLPGGFTGTLTYRGGWNAATNTPVMASGAVMGGIVQPAGNYFIVTVSGTTTPIDGITTWVAGDWASSNGTTWERVQIGSSPYLPLTGGTVVGPTTHTSTLALNGATTVGADTAATTLALNGPVVARPLFWNTAGLPRWELRANNAAESGGNLGSDLDLFAYTDAGAVLGQVQRYSRSNGNVTWNNNRTFADPQYNFNAGSITVDKTINQGGVRTFTSGVAPGLGGLSPLGIRQIVTFTGVLDTGSGNPNFNSIITTDTVNASRTLPFTAQMVMNHSYNTGASGDRTQISLLYSKNAASADGIATGPFNIISMMHCDVGESTNPAAPLSRASCVNFDTRIGGTGYSWSTLCCQENDIRVFAGNTVDVKTNISVHWGVSDAVHGTIEDNGIVFHCSPTIAPGTGGGKTMLQFGGNGQGLPWDPLLAGTSIMQVGGNVAGNLPYGWNPTVTYGIDLRGLNFTTAAWRSTGITIDGAGQIPVLGPSAITHSTSGTKISVPNVRAVSATVAAGGTAYRVNDVVVDTMGSLWTVATVGGAGSAALTVSLLRTGYASPAPGNPVATAFGTGSGLTLTVTTAATGTLTLGDTGQTVNVSGKLNIAGIPTSNAGLSSGDIWSNGGVLMVVP